MATKYVSIAGSNANNGNTAGTAYQTFSFANENLNNGDTVSFERGYEYPPMDYVSKQINITSHGSGALPIFSGFVTTSGWVDEGSGVWSFTDAGLPTLLNVVSIDGVFRPRRIAPTYRTFTAHTGTGYGTITDATLPDSPSLVGAEVVIRKRHWVLDRALITAHSEGVITHANLDARHALTYTPLDGYGYFIQNHNSVMTTVGDWRYDGTAKKLYMYFGAGNPSSYVIKASKVARAFHTGDSGGSVTYSDIHVTGFNQYGWSAIAANTILQRVKFSMIGEYGVYTTGINSISYDACVFEDMPNNAITGDGGCNNWTVNNNCTFTRIHHHAGAGGSSDTKGMAVAVFGDNANVQYNVFTDCGYEPVYVRGNGFIVDKNLIDTFGYNKDDGGGIYTFEGTRITNSVRRSIKNNIILNGIGAGLGTADGENKAFGLYPDERASEIDIEGNLIAYCNKGYFGHNAYDVNIRNKNIFYDNDIAIHIRSYDAANPSTDIDLDGNVILAKTGQKLIVHDSAAASNTSWGTSNNNKFYSNDANPFQTRVSEGSFVDQSFAGWKTATGKDGASTLATFSGDIIRYNATATPAGVSIPGTYIDSQGVSHAGTITLGDHESELLFLSAATGKILTRGGKILTRGGKILITG